MTHPLESPDLFAALSAATTAGEPVVLATVVRAQGSVPRHAGAKLLVYADGRTLGTVGGGELEARVFQAAAECLRSGEPGFLTYNLVDPERGDPGVCGGTVDVYLEPYGLPTTVLVVGAGHVGRALARLASWAGFRVVVHDDRAELVTPELFPEADLLLPGPLKDALGRFTITPLTYIAMLTRNVLVDRQILPLLVESPAPYIGVIGSQRRWRETIRLLREDGLAEAALARCHSPIGLELNAETPEEISVSILAEIIMLHRGGSGERMGAPAGQAVAPDR